MAYTLYFEWRPGEIAGDAGSKNLDVDDLSSARIAASIYYAEAIADGVPPQGFRIEDAGGTTVYRYPEDGQ